MFSESIILEIPKLLVLQKSAILLKKLEISKNSCTTRHCLITLNFGLQLEVNDISKSVSKIFLLLCLPTDTLEKWKRTGFHVIEGASLSNFLPNFLKTT